MTLHSLKKKLSNIKVYLKEGALHLEGEVDNYETFLSYGKLAVKLKSRGVVNDLTIKGLKAKPMREPNVEDSTLEGKHCDVLIIGAGIVGCAIARE
ncbi:MAG: FAD-binding oxidoreductase, partial [Spirochaetales bacterium]|nr:FAD-binding oxidoreductase [Spirochaetales bacterium]